MVRLGRSECWFVLIMWLRVTNKTSRMSSSSSVAKTETWPNDGPAIAGQVVDSRDLNKDGVVTFDEAMQTLSPTQNTILGCVAGAIEVTSLQSFLYCKNATQQGIPLTLDPRKLYRGYTMSLTNMCVLTAVQFPLTNFVTGLVTGGKPRKLSDGEMLFAGFGGGALSGFLCSPMELVMIQQQRFGTSLLATPAKVSVGVLRSFVRLSRRAAPKATSTRLTCFRLPWPLSLFVALITSDRGCARAVDVRLFLVSRPCRCVISPQPTTARLTSLRCNLASLTPVTPVTLYPQPPAWTVR